jgi:hypothetical protein
MPDMPPQKPRNKVQLTLGFLLGIVATLFIVFFSIFLTSTLSPRHSRMYPVFTGIALIALGLAAFRNSRTSNFALGAMVALGLAVLLDAAYMAAVFR